jgi:hypothetical protein
MKRQLHSMHEMTIRVLVGNDPRIQRNGFAAALRAAVDRDNEDGDGDEVERVARQIIPDAFMIDEGARVVTVYEVEDTCPITYEKMRLLGGIGFALDCEDWEFNLVVVDRYGGQREVDWYRYYMTSIAIDIETGAIQP